MVLYILRAEEQGQEKALYTSLFEHEPIDST